MPIFLDTPMIPKHYVYRYMYIFAYIVHMYLHVCVYIYAWSWLVQHVCVYIYMPYYIRIRMFNTYAHLCYLYIHIYTCTHPIWVPGHSGITRKPPITEVAIECGLAPTGLPGPGAYDVASAGEPGSFSNRGRPRPYVCTNVCIGV